MSDQKDYNPLFETFVQKGQSEHAILTGVVAYGLYKHSKREWAEAIREQHKRGPTSEELDQYVATWTPSQIESKKSQAVNILASYAGSVIQSERPKILTEALRGRFWVGVWQSVLGAAIFTIALLALFLVLLYFGVPLPSLPEWASRP